MKIESNLQQRQSQVLTITPQMQQSLKILQMPSVELRDYLQTLLLENPFLTEELVADSPLENENNNSIDDYFQYEWQALRSQKAYDSDSEGQVWERVAHKKNLKDHLREQLYIKTTSDKLRYAGDFIIDSIDDDGYLRKSLAILVEESDCEYNFYEEALGLIHNFYPTGVGARNLSECLFLQLQEKALLTPEIELILEYLEKLGDLGPDKFASRFGFCRDRLKEIITLFQTLHPKPGLKFSTSLEHLYVTPDILVRRDRHGKWECELNQNILPRLMIDRESYAFVHEKSLEKRDRHYVKDKMRKAEGILGALQQRYETLLSVAQVIVRVQQDFFTSGRGHLNPLLLSEVAREVGCHESTVSRAVTGKYISTPQGTLELRELLSRSVQSSLSFSKEEDISSKVIQLKLKILIDAENKREPLSDDQLVMMLKDNGYKIARRTISKYRDLLNIPSSYERKKLCRLMTF